MAVRAPRCLRIELALNYIRANVAPTGRTTTFVGVRDSGIGTIGRRNRRNTGDIVLGVAAREQEQYKSCEDISHVV